MGRAQMKGNATRATNGAVPACRFVARTVRPSDAASLVRTAAALSQSSSRPAKIRKTNVSERTSILKAIVT